MSDDKKERRKHIVFCDDVNCYFKRSCRNIEGLAGECTLDVKLAKRFFEQYGVTTCEAGTGQIRFPEEILELYRLNKFRYKRSEGLDM